MDTWEVLISWHAGKVLGGLCMALFVEGAVLRGL